jgi:hypothetical protein
VAAVKIIYWLDIEPIPTKYVARCPSTPRVHCFQGVGWVFTFGDFVEGEDDVITHVSDVGQALQFELNVLPDSNLVQRVVQRSYP